MLPRYGKTERIALRVSEAQRALLDEASRVDETTLTEFVLRAATQRAGEVLADRHRFVLSDDAWDAFTRMLDRPVTDKPQLRRLLAAPPVLDSRQESTENSTRSIADTGR